MRIEDLFRDGKTKTMFCTSTLVEGVNLPADNLFIISYKNGVKTMSEVDFKNLIGWVGRIEFNLYGTTNPLTITLQRSGFTREPATYIKTHRDDAEKRLGLL